MSDICSKEAINHIIESNESIQLNYPIIQNGAMTGDTSEDPDNDENDKNSTENSEFENIFTRVTNLVRRQYLNYVQKLLKMNYESWCMREIGFIQVPSEILITNCAQKYEEKAVKSCMIVQLYRKTMLKIIAEIRRETSHGRLVHELQQIKSDEEIKENLKNFKNVETQTVEGDVETKNEYDGDLNLIGIREMRHECLSLQEKIQYFQDKLDEREKKIKEITTKDDNDERQESTTNGKSSYYSYQHRNSHYHHHNSHNHNDNHHHRRHHHHHHRNDEIMKPRKRRISHTEQIRENEISSISSSSPQTNQSAVKKRNIQTASVPTAPVSQKIEDEIAKELEELLGEQKNLEEEIFGDGDAYNPQIEQILKEIEEAKLPAVDNDNNEMEISPKFNNDNDEMPENHKTKTNLNDSLWPCELYMRERKLRTILSELSEHKGMRCYEKIRERFFELFGEDSEDEFAPYSPTIETNEILLESCKKRIAPWIVKYLMIPMKDGLIGNRFLFKKLAKRLAHSIITVNLYPDENAIKEAVEDFFCHKRAINSMRDIDEINLEASGAF